MAHRLSKITTRTGDAGETGLGDGARVSKDSARVHALATSTSSTQRSACARRRNSGEPCEKRSARCSTISSTSAASSASRAHAARRGEVGSPRAPPRGWNTNCPRSRSSSCPAGSRAAAAAHLARTVCRRAERSVVALARTENVSDVPARRYLNRLSDLLFVAGRMLNQPCRRRRCAVAPRAQK